MRTNSVTVWRFCKPDSILSALLLGFLGLTQSANAQAAGTFVATGQMNNPRFGHTASLLRDGKVLIAGGWSFNGGNFPLKILASTEIYDPSTLTFTPAGNMTFPRFEHTAILLKDGRVLIAGGKDQELTAELTAELYDPSTGTFRPTGNMIRRGSAVTLLDNGKVLLADDTGKFQLYDPGTGVFEDAGQFEGDIIEAVATPLADGRILVVGQKSDSTANVTFIYDPAVRTFSHAGNLVQYPVPSGYFAALDYFTLTPLANGGVLLAGGCYPEINTIGDCWEADTAEFYDPATQAFTDTGHLTQAPSGGTATMLLGGTVLIAGGSTSSGELYDPLTGTFAGVGRMTAPRVLHTATLLADGTVLIAGGFDTLSRSGAVFNSAELYVPAPSAVSSANLAAPLAPESLASVFGSGLAAVTAAADPQSLPTSLGGISLGVRDSTGIERLAPILYVSPMQINFEVPAGTTIGNAVLDIAGASTTLPPVPAQVRAIAPGLFTSPTNRVVAYALRVEVNGQLTVLPAGSPIVLDDRPVYLILFGTGIRNRSSVENVRCTIGGISVPVEYAGPSGTVVPGLDQVNVRLTAALRGNRDGHLVLTVDGVAANTVLADVR